MIKRMFFLSLLLILLISCSSLEFVYNDSDKLNKIEEKTLFTISGDNVSAISSYLLSKLGEADDSAIYLLTIESSTLDEATVIETDATASKFMIKHNLKYSLENINENCKILEENISSRSLYDAKSAGYSFGTDLAKKELSEKNLYSNIDQFLTSIDYHNLDCKNES